MPVCGGIDPNVKPADDTVKGIIEKVKEEIQTKIGRVFEKFEAVSYRTQLVNGVNYFVKVQVGDDEHLHVRAHKSFQGEVTLSAYQEGKALEDEIVYFQ
ncbi:cystatin-A2-like isoform X1 [Centruroides vittatus]|uniref:cystatin-A2-like isoform X1 n=1 Tax=Centruroides vittatus TaxID=120091 RepID=UPI00351045CD